MNACLCEALIDDGVGGKWNSLFVYFSVSSLENEFSNSFSGRVAEGDVWLYFTEEVGGSFVDSDENSVMKLSQS